MDNRGDSVREAHPLFQEGSGGATPTSPLSLRVVRVQAETAIALNRLWHSRLPDVDLSNVTRTKNRAFYAAEHDGIYYATAIWTNPVARMLPQDTWLELRRLAIAPDAPRNTASRMLRVMALLIRRDLSAIVKLVSYQDTEVHTGAIYRAAGWVKSRLSEGGEWSRPSRKRDGVQSAAPKQRWEYQLREESHG